MQRVSSGISRTAGTAMARAKGYWVPVWSLSRVRVSSARQANNTP